MAAITVQHKETGCLLNFDTVAEVGSAAEFIGFVKENEFGEGVLLKPNGSVFTEYTPEPFPQGMYMFQPKSGTSSASSNIRLQHTQ